MIHVIKLGGSLLDLPDLVARFESWLRAEAGVELLACLEADAAKRAAIRGAKPDSVTGAGPILKLAPGVTPGNAPGIEAALVVGGGAAADAVRAFDQRFHLGPVASHWLAIRAMQFNTLLVAAVLPECRLASSLRECEAAWHAGKLAIIDPLAWLERDERARLGVPHRWSFTSDSVAGYIAGRLGARRLTLLKSSLPKRDMSRPPQPLAGTIVDEDFFDASADVPRVDLVNLRVLPPQRFVYR
jgi:5-(aminomethyl)-3-furanmethanol phosphate kinase